MVKMYALFSYTFLWSIGNICVAANGATHFSCVASAAHFFIFKEVVIMYDNIGSKIKKLAIILTIAESIVFFIAGVVMLVGEMGGLALLFMFAGPLFAWASSFLLYGFGELIDKVCDIERNTRNLENVKEVENNEQKAEVTVDKKHIDPNKYICNSFFVTEKTTSGKCMICMQNVARANYCKIKNSIGTREIPVCQDCIAMFEKHNESK